MHLEELKDLMYHDSKYYFLFTDFEHAITSHLIEKDGSKESKEIYTAFLFLGPHHLYKIGLEFKTESSYWNLVLLPIEVNLPAINSFEYKNNLFPNNWEIEKKCHNIIAKFDSISFFKKSTLPEVLNDMAKSISNLFANNKVVYSNDFSDKLMECLSLKIDFNSADVQKMIFNDKEKVILYNHLNKKFSSLHLNNEKFKSSKI